MSEVMKYAVGMGALGLIALALALWSKSK